jgi:hypothetical protein
MTADGGSLAQALLEAQKKLPLTVATDSKNPHFGSGFLSLGGLIAATRPALNDAGIVITQFPGVNEQGQPVIRTTLTHGATGEELSFEMPLFPDKPGMQAYGSAITYGRRYAWASAIGVASEEDTDGNVHAGSEQPAQPAAEAAVKMASGPQRAKMGILVKELAATDMQIPAEFPGAETWTDVLRLHLGEEYGVTTRTDLTMEQASRVIDWLEELKIPF